MFNAEEIGMLSAFDTFSRETAIKDIRDHLSYIRDEEMKTVIIGILKKLERMSDDEFCSYDLTFMEDPEDESR